jgi:hypothetical protein
MVLVALGALVATRVRLVSLCSLLIAVASGVTATLRVPLLVPAVLFVTAAIWALCLRVLGLAITITMTAILGFGASIRSVVFTAGAGLTSGVITVESSSKDGAGSVEESAKAALLLLLLTAGRGHLVAGVLLNHTRKSASSTLQDGIGGGTSNLVLDSLGTTVELAHLELTSTAVAVTSVIDALLVVLAVLDAVTGQLAAVVLTLVIAHLTPPLLDVLVAAASALLDLAVAHITLGRVMQDTADDVVEEPIHIDTLIINGVHELRDNPVHHAGSVSASNFVENLRLS